MSGDSSLVGSSSGRWEVRLVAMLWRLFSSATCIVAIIALALVDILFGAAYYSLWFKFLPFCNIGQFVVDCNLLASLAVSVITSGVQISFWANVHRGKNGIFYVKRSDCSSVIDYFVRLLPALAVIGVMILDTLADSGGFTRVSLGSTAAENIFPSHVPFGWWVVDLVIMLALSFDEKIAASLLPRNTFLHKGDNADNTSNCGADTEVIIEVETHDGKSDSVDSVEPVDDKKCDVAPTLEMEKVEQPKK